MKHALAREQLVRQPSSEVFAFFADTANLEQITPASLRFKILTVRPIAMHAGTVIDYELALFGVPFEWRTLVEPFEPESRFVDVQLKGQYPNVCIRYAWSFDLDACAELLATACGAEVAPSCP